MKLPFCRRRLDARIIASLADELADTTRQRDHAQDLAERRGDLIAALTRENQQLRQRLGDAQRDAIGGTVPLPRVRSHPAPASDTAAL